MLNHGFELVIGQINGVELRGGVQRDDPLPDGPGVNEVQLRENTDVFFENRRTFATEEIAALLPDRHHLNVLVAAVPHEIVGGSRHVGVECAAQSPVGRHHHHENPFFRAHSQERVPNVLDSGREICKNGFELRGVRPRGKDAVLRAAQFGGGYGFHRAGDLLGVPYGADPAPNIEKVRHDLPGPALCRVPVRKKAFLGFHDRSFEFGGQFVVKDFLFSDICEDLRFARLEEAEQRLFEIL